LTLAFAHIDRLDERRIERLDDERRLCGDDLAAAVDDTIEPHENRDQQQRYHKPGEDIDRRAHPEGLGALEDLRGFGLKQPDQLVRRGITAPRSGTE
jgi:hypothetical protein